MRIENNFRRWGRMRPLHRNLMVLGVVLVVASVSYGFVLWDKAVKADEFRTMVYNISATMGEHPGCLD